MVIAGGNPAALNTPEAHALPPPRRMAGILPWLNRVGCISLEGGEGTVPGSVKGISRLDPGPGWLRDAFSSRLGFTNIPVGLHHLGPLLTCSCCGRAWTELSGTCPCLCNHLNQHRINRPRGAFPMCLSSQAQVFVPVVDFKPHILTFFFK